MNAAQIAALQQQPGGAAAAAAQIQASEANVQARVTAVQYLGTVDCTRWPEARKALINSLREDPNECVRFAAARALNSGCCCNQEVIEALRICVSGESKGNAPPETSCRVKASAFSALQNCLLRVPEKLPPEVPPEPSPAPEPGNLPVAPERATQNIVENPHVAASYSGAPRNVPSLREPQPRRTFAQTVDDARRTMFAVSQSPRPPAVLATGRRSLLDALAKAREEMESSNLRNTRDQGRVQHTTPKLDTATAPTSYTLAAAAVKADSRPSSDDGQITAPSGDGAGPAPSVKPKSNARRGLIGMLFQSSAR